jgi:hypothetical protein
VVAEGCVTKRIERFLKACLMGSSTFGSGMSNGTTGIFAVAFAQCSNLGVSRDPVLNAVDGVDSHSHRTVKSTTKMV